MPNFDFDELDRTFIDQGRVEVKWYCVIERDSIPGPFLSADKADLKGIHSLRFIEGTAIEGWPDGVTFAASRYTPGERADDALATANAVPVYSQRLQEALRNAGVKDIQFLPCRVINGLGVELPGYQVANVIETRHAFAPEHGLVRYRDKSKQPLFTDENIQLVHTYALYEEALGDCDAIRLPESPIRILVSERFKKAYDSIGATGIDFRETVMVQKDGTVVHPKKGR